MKKFVALAAVCILSFALTACQSSGVGTSNFGSKSVTKKTRYVSTYSAGKPRRRFVNEAASLIVKRPAAKRLKKRKVVSRKASRKRSSKRRVASRKSRGSTSSRRGRYRRLIAKHARANGVPVKLAMAVVQAESSYRANARGAAGEIGLMQLRPRTARMIGYRGKMKNLYNPDTNLRYGMKYLGKAYKLGKGSTCRTILKYNAGHGAKRMNPISQRYCNRVRRMMR